MIYILKIYKIKLKNIRRRRKILKNQKIFIENIYFLLIKLKLKFIFLLINLNFDR